MDRPRNKCQFPAPERCTAFSGGARINGSPWRNRAEPELPLPAEVLRFFDHYLMGLSAGREREVPVHYFTMDDERWNVAAYERDADVLRGAATQTRWRMRGVCQRLVQGIVRVRHRQADALRAHRRDRNAGLLCPIGTGVTMPC
jgi:hypothetical protein